MEEVTSKDEIEDSEIINILTEFKDNDNQDQITFPVTLSSNKRRRIHEISAKIDLLSLSTNSDYGRFITVKKTRLYEYNTSSISRWTVDKATQWYNRFPWLVGCNYIPSNASNQLEMWGDDIFDAETINYELGLARGLGFNVVRVYLHDLLWYNLKDELIKRINIFLDICKMHNIYVILVLWDDCHRPNPVWGKQRPPIKGVHNSNWLQSPGLLIVNQIYDDTIDEKLLIQMKDYITGIITIFRDDNRVIMWDLYNEPGQNNNHDKSNKLLKLTWDWARSINPSQPISSCLDGCLGYENYYTNLYNSDILTLHEYNYKYFENKIINLHSKHNNRPIICTEYMAREQGSTFQAILPLGKKLNVGCISWGLVNGKTQTHYNWDTTKILDTLVESNGNMNGDNDTVEPELWFHDIFHIDGSPYKTDEVEFIRDITKNNVIDNENK